MSIKKSLLAFAVAAMATMAFASPALAVDGVLRDVTNGKPIEAPAVLHAVGWAKFETASGSSLECHVTSNIAAVGATGTTGSVTAFTIPVTANCTGKSGLAGCVVKTHESKNLPYVATVTNTGRVDVTGNIQIHNTYTGCLVKTTLLKISEVTLTPLKTGERNITGGTGEAKLGVTAALEDPVAGFEIDGFTANGEVEIETSFGTKMKEALKAVTGEFELTKAERCTYKISAS